MAFVTVSSCRHSFLAWPPGRAAVTNGYTHGMCCDGCQCVPVRVCQCVRRTVLLGPGRPGPAACDSSHWQSCRVAESDSVAAAAVGADAAVPARTLTAGEILLLPQHFDSSIPARRGASESDSGSRGGVGPEHWVFLLSRFSKFCRTRTLCRSAAAIRVMDNSILVQNRLGAMSFGTTPSE